MFDIREYYKTQNERVRDSYEDGLTRIREIRDMTKDNAGESNKKEFYRFLNVTGNFILKLAAHEKNIDSRYFSTVSFDELLRENNEVFRELKPENFTESYANPTFCVNIFGDDIGKLFSHFYCVLRQYITHASHRKIFKMEERNKLFIDVFDHIKHNTPDYAVLLEIITRITRRSAIDDIILDMKEAFEKEHLFNRDIVENSNLSDLRYLFKYGSYISEHEIKASKYIANLPQDEIEKLSSLIAKSYMNGFIRDKKDISKKSTAGVVFNIGQERIIRQLIGDLQDLKLQIILNNPSSTNVNKQYQYDHRFDAALFMDEDYTSRTEKNTEVAFETIKEMLSAFSGGVYFDQFGEPPFKPENKKECLKYSEEQQKLIQNFQNNMVGIQEKYLPRKEWSFTAIAFPSPEIGDNYETIFTDIMAVNMLDEEHYERIQQTIIDTLDMAEYVHVKGKGKSETDIKVKMQEITNPKKETNFMNCGADINIPVGEVYTSPRLNGTNGVLHIEHTYLSGLKFNNLKLTFKDGMIVDYSCDNFDNDEDNRKYIEENLLFPHKTLPVGEFAIGTNTLAYVIAKKHDILDVLPVLIIEKMGPHFAIGDTCFAHDEDKPVFNRLDNKEIIARENEKSALRKTQMNEAYTHHHTDITIPYESIDFIAAITMDGKAIDIIKDGRFVLDGTRELNIPFE